MYGCHYSPEWLVICVQVFFVNLHKEIRNKYLADVQANILLVPGFFDQPKNILWVEINT